MNLLITAISEGFLWGVMALGLYISFRILNVPDMTTEGTFPLGAATASALIVNGMNPVLATVIAFFAGTIGGAITGILMTKLRVPPLLAGILSMTGLYSINLRVMGSANISLLDEPRLTNLFGNYINLPPNYDTILMGLVISIILITLLILFFKTDFGQGLIATGDNERMAKSMGINPTIMKIFGLMAANGLIALSGALVAQDNGYADISMGIGTIVIGLASVMIAEVVFGNLSLGGRIVSLVAGSIIYRFVMSLALALGMPPNDLKLISAILLVLVIAIPKLIGDSNVQLFKKRKEGN